MRILNTSRFSGVTRTVSGAALACLSACSSGSTSEGLASTRQAVTAPPTEQIRLSFTLPGGAVLDNTVLSAAKAARLADSTQVYGDLVTSGGPADFGTDVKVGNLFINGDATLRDRTQVFGNVVARHVVKTSSVTVSGTVTETTAQSVTPVTWTVTASSTNLGDVNLPPDQARDLAPGKYQHFSINSRSTVTLHSGVYHLADFSMESQARLVVEDSKGPVQVIVDGNFTYRGTILPGALPVPQVLFAVRGTSASVESPFVGVLVAPSADVRFQAAQPNGHRAFVFGSTVALEPGTRIDSLPFSWGDLSGDFSPKTEAPCFVPVAASQPCPARGTRTGILLPKDVSPEDVSLAATGVLTLSARAQANDSLVNVGHWQTSLGTSALSGGLWSEAATAIGSSARVAGSVFSHSTVTLGSQAQVTGSVVQNTPLSATIPTLWLALFPSDNSGPVNVAPNTTSSLAPGDYGALTLAVGAKLSLSGGTYTFDSLSTSATSAITVSAKDTPVIVHVRQGFSLRGPVTRSADANQGVLFTYLGKDVIALSQPFQGTLAAPFASLQLGATSAPYRGAFFARNVALAADAVVQHVPFGSWAALPGIEDTRRGPLPTIQTRTSAGAPPTLDSTPASAQQFVGWLVRATKGDLAAARAALQQTPDKDAATANLAQIFNAARAADSSRATMVLNAIGFLHTAGAESLFTSLVNEPLPAVTSDTLDGVQDLRQLERYQTAAVHGLAFLHSSTADGLLKSLMHSHASAQIRSEAVRAFLFHNPSTDRAALAATLRPEEGYLVDRFENRNSSTASTFDDRMNAYLAKHPQL